MLLIVFYCTGMLCCTVLYSAQYSVCCAVVIFVQFTSVLKYITYVYPMYHLHCTLYCTCCTIS